MKQIPNTRIGGQPDGKVIPRVVRDSDQPVTRLSAITFGGEQASWDSPLADSLCVCTVKAHRSRQPMRW